MISLLFDIDGTLLRAGNAGMKAVHESLVEMFGEVEEAKMLVHGRTDHGIMTDVFAGIGQDYQKHRNEFDQLYWSKLPEVMATSGGELLPGVLQLLEALSAEPDMALGILTGNARAAADIKLKFFGIEQYFSFGGYGDHDSDRNQVAALAVAEARSSLKDSFDSDQVWVIGDTVNDIRCGRSVGAKVIAVETGGGTRKELLEAEPDIVFKDLANKDAFLTTVRK
ncbi:HAD hydrolase-like protein [Mariniblastus sp.]|nr:HAD hydrolase-like protein [Mariniblastus sp.]